MTTYDLLHLNFPLERPHCGIVMGNGNFGVMVWGKERLNITVNRADFWDHRGGELIAEGTTYKKLVAAAKIQNCDNALEKAIIRNLFPDNVFKPQRLPAGRFEFSFADEIFPLRASLHYNTGTVEVEVTGGKKIFLDLDLNRALLLIRDASNIIIRADINPAWDFPQSRAWLEKYAFVPPQRFYRDASAGWIQPCPEDPSMACICRKRENGYALALETGADNNTALRQAENMLDNIDEKKLLADNYSWWKKYWKDLPMIDLPDDWYNRFYKYALYKFAAATRPDGCACGLQGPWHEEYQRAQWSGDYHFNVNVQQIYSLAFPTGKLQHLLPLFDMIESESFQKALRSNAQTLFGIDDGLWFTHAVDDRGWQCGWLSCGSILDPACGAWTALLYYQYYQYSLDIDFLIKRAMPFIKGIMRGYEAMLEEYEGRLSIPLAISAEYASSNRLSQRAGRDPSYQLAATHMLADILLKICEITGTPAKPIWMDIKKRLPPFTVINAKDSSGNDEQRIAIWEGQDLDVCHRHHSHLAGIYPFATLKLSSPRQTEIIDNSIDHWIGKGMGQWSEWCIPWAAIIYSRLGFSEAPVILLDIWKKVFINEGLATVYLPRSRGIIAHRRHDLKKPKETSEIMQLDGTMGAATALLEMLVHQRGDTVYLFQGIPEAWSNVSFANVFLPGGFTISAKRGEYVRITSSKGGILKLCINQQIEILSFSPQETKDIDI